MGCDQPRLAAHLLHRHHPHRAPAPGPDAAVEWVRAHLGDLCCDVPVASAAFRGGQQAADTVLAGLDLVGYAARRNEVLPRSRRGASRISPYVRHGLIDLPAAWTAAAPAPPRDRTKFRAELEWQDYARHLYARVGRRTATALTAHPDRPAVFVFDGPLLVRLRLSGKRLVFLAETLADLSTRRRVEVRRGEVAGELRGRAVAVTHAPVPGFRSRAAATAAAVVHPWRWLYRPHPGPIGSYSAWRKGLGAR